MKQKISFIGSGNVAWNLAAAFDKAGNQISQIVSRSGLSAKALAEKYGAYYGNDYSELYNDADLVLISVSDDAYPEVIEKLNRGVRGVVCHTSGSQPLGLFENTGFKAGVFYPLQSLSKTHLIDLMEAPLLIESSDVATEKFLYHMADQISNKVRVVDSSDRLRYHLAAVFANNFTNFMYACADEILIKQELDFDLLLPIIKETAERLKYDKAKNLQTGPARRKDNMVIKKHLDLLTDTELRKIYETLSNGIMTLH